MASFLRFPQVRIRVGLSRSTIYLKILHGQFPKPVNLGARAVAWLESDIDTWIAAQVEQSSGNEKCCLTHDARKACGSDIENSVKVRDLSSTKRRQAASAEVGELPTV